MLTDTLPPSISGDGNLAPRLEGAAHPLRLSRGHDQEVSSAPTQKASSLSKPYIHKGCPGKHVLEYPLELFLELFLEPCLEVILGSLFGSPQTPPAFISADGEFVASFAASFAARLEGAADPLSPSRGRGQEASSAPTHKASSLSKPYLHQGCPGT